MSTISIQSFFDEPTNTVTYVVADTATRQCAVIDSVLDFDASSGRTDTASARQVVDYIKAHSLSLTWILETHVHADHLSAAPFLKETLGGQIAIGEHVTAVQKAFKTLYNMEASFPADGREFDRLLGDGEELSLGETRIRIISTPGHTPACVSYLISDALFVGDTLFMPDSGTARTDFPGGDAGQLYDSIQRMFSLPDDTRMFLCHDYKAPERDTYQWETRVSEQRQSNIHIHDGISKARFIEMREARDATLSVPKLLLPSIQVNMRAGQLPPAAENGIQYLVLPLNQL